MRIKLPLNIIELEPNNYHLIISCRFSDGSSGNWVIDTGASKTVFDKTLEKKYKISESETEQIHSAGINEEPLETTIGHMKSITLGKLEIKGYKVALLDLSHINDLYRRSTNLEICGLIGSDFLMKYKAVIDYKKRVLILKTK